MKQLSDKIAKLEVFASFYKKIVRINEDDNFENYVFTVISKEMEKRKEKQK